MLILGSNVLLILIMVYLADHGRCSGVMNNKAILISTVLTLLLVPSFVETSTALLTLVLPEQAALVISGMISVPLLFILIKIIFHKLAALPKYQYDKADKIVGAVFGVIKGFLLVVFIVMLYAGLFLDRLLPAKATEFVKGNLTNMAFEHQIDYYRHKIFYLHQTVSGSKLSDISSDRPDSTGQTNTLLGSISQDSVSAEAVYHVDDYIRLSWLGEKYLLENPLKTVSLPDSVSSAADSIAADSVTAVSGKK